jgi:hypothetical protein
MEYKLFFKIYDILYNMLLQEEFSIILTSDPSGAASNISADGSRFEVQLDESLRVPDDAINCNISMENATIWWSVANIITGTNDKMYIHGLDTSDVEQDFTITIPQGLYDLPALNLKIQQLLENADGKISPYNNIDLIADNATSKVVIKFNYSVNTIDFSQSDTPRTTLGFASAVYGAYAGAPENVLAPDVANFNSVDSFLLHCDLVDRGILMNNSYSQVVGQVLIDVSPGSQIIYNPFNPTKVEANNLIGASRRTIRVFLTDQAGDPVNTNGEFYSLKLKVSYMRPLMISK